MTSPEQSARPRRLVQVLAVLVAQVVLLLGAELVARLTGHAPWNNEQGALDQAVEPGGTLFAPHASLGYALVPGTLTVKSGSLTWRTTHLDAFRRAVGEQPSANAAPGRPAVWVFGDSYAYGWGVDDTQTFPAVLQARHPELEVVSLAVGGYSTLQMLLEFEEAIRAGRAPRQAIVTYSSFHDGRSAMLRGNRKAWMPYVDRYPRFPVAWLADGRLVYESRPLEYAAWPLQESSAFVNLLDEKFNKLTVLTSRAQDTSKALLQKFQATCREHDVQLVVAGIYPNSRTSGMVKWAASQGMAAVDISADHRRPENLTNGHPNANANRQYAEKLEPFLPAAPERAAVVTP